LENKVIIHIGYPKTGTTWFANNFYPKIKDFYFVPPETIISELISNNYLKISEKLSKHNKLIISDPEFCGVIKYNWNNGIYRQQIAEHLKILFPNTQIIIFIRNQIEFLASSYVYYIRKGGTQKPLELFNSMINSEFSIPLEYMEYHKIIQLYQDLFGTNNIHVFLYEEFLENNFNFIKNYISIFNFDLSYSSVNYKPLNEMLKKPLLNFIRFTNKFTNKEVKNKKVVFHIPFIYEIINKNYSTFNKFLFFGNKPNIQELFDNKTLDFLNNYYSKSNNKLIDNMELSLIKKYKYPI